MLRRMRASIDKWKLTKRVKIYMENSSIHGLKYIAERNRHCTERLFWVVSCFVSTWCMASLAAKSYANFINKPVSFVLNVDRLHWNTSFPAISVCETDSDLGAITIPAARLFGELRNLDLDTFLRDIVFFDGKCYSCEELCGKSINCTEDLSYLIKQVRQPCQTLLSNCSWMGQPINCCILFKPLVTETGLCYSSNSIHVPNTKDQTEFVTNKHTGPGQLQFKVSKDVYVYMHTTEDVPYINTPQESKNMVILGTNLKVAFKVTEIENDPKLKSLSVEQRKCRFPLENNLKVYKYYSYSGCVVNCRTEAQIKLCNCTHHLLPKIHNFETCTISGLTCLSKNAKTIGSIKAIDSNKPGLVCSCIPSCTEHDHQTVEKIQTSYEDKSYSLIRIYMTSLPTIRFQRYIVRTNLDLVVSLGGTAGLFLGASLLSIAELFDFMLLRRLHKHLTRSADGNNLRNVAENKNINDAFLNKTTHNCKVKPIFVHYLP